MIPQFQHEATTSFALWLDHYLIYNAEAYSNKQGSLIICLMKDYNVS